MPQYHIGIERISPNCWQFHCQICTKIFSINTAQILPTRYIGYSSIYTSILFQLQILAICQCSSSYILTPFWLHTDTLLATQNSRLTLYQDYASNTTLSTNYTPIMSTKYILVLSISYILILRYTTILPSTVSSYTWILLQKQLPIFSTNYEPKLSTSCRLSITPILPINYTPILSITLKLSTTYQVC